MNIYKINAAIRAGLDDCRGTENVITALAVFLADLKQAGGWSHDELHAVEFGILRLLNAIADTTTRPEIGITG